MKIAVLVKSVPDTETKIKLSDSKLNQSDFKYVINPYDEYAVEEALKIQEAHAGSESIVISCGPKSCQDSMRKAMAMGIDRGIHINFEPTDSYQVAFALSEVLKEEAPQIILGGQKAIDDDTGHVGVMVAEILNIPHVQVVSKLIWKNDSSLVVEREVEGGMIEVIETSLPVYLGAHKNLNAPRFTSLPGIMKAKKKPLVEKTPGSIPSALVEIHSYMLPLEKPAGKIFKGEPVEAMVQKVVGLLRTEAKVL